MNPNVNVKAYEDRVGADTETTFNDDFFGQLDGVITALDNVEARLQTDPFVADSSIDFNHTLRMNVISVICMNGYECLL